MTYRFSLSPFRIHNITKLLVFLALLAGSIFFFMEPARAQTAPGVPTLVVPSAQKFFQTTNQKPLLRGLTQNNTQVAVYIDNSFYGYAEVKNANNGTTSFAYVPFLHLKPGFHSVQVRAHRLDGKVQSALSTRVDFEILKPFPSPTLLTPVVNPRTTATQPFIIGLTWVPARVRIFIDGKLNGEMEVSAEKNAKVFDFAYKPFLPLEAGKHHSVYATAVDSSGKESLFSPTVNFYIPKFQKPDSESAEQVSEQSEQEVAPNAQQSNTEQSQTQTEETNTDTTNPATQDDQDQTSIPDNPETQSSESEVSPNDTAESSSATQNTNDADQDARNTTETDTDLQDNEITASSVSPTETSETPAETETPSQPSNRTWILWLVIALAILVVLFRNRGALHMPTQKQDGASTSNPTTPSSTTSSPEAEATSQNRTEQSSKTEPTPSSTQETNKASGKDDKLPPPPPSASGY